MLAAVFHFVHPVEKDKGCPNSEARPLGRRNLVTRSLVDKAELGKRSGYEITQIFLELEMSPINFYYLHSFSVKLQNVPIIHTTMALHFTANPAQQTRAIVSLEA